MINREYIKQLLQKLVDANMVLQPDELRYLKNLFDSCEGKVYIESMMQEVWGGSSVSENRVDYDVLFTKITSQIKRRNTPKHILLRLQRVAAILLIPIILTMFFLMKPSMDGRLLLADLDTVGPYEQEYYIPAGTKSKITLPDSSRIWLNANSRLIIEPNFGRETRRVRLSGEAFFEVSKNQEAPFEISVYDMNIRVLGTSFNLSAYPNNSFVEAVLVEGAIEVGSGRYASKSLKTTRMKPSQRLALNKTDYRLTIEENVATDLYTAWKENRLVYNNTSMSDVAKTLERWFNVLFIIKDSELNTYTYTGKFEDRSLEQILNFIQLSSPIAYQIKKDTVTLSLKYKQ